MRYTTVWIPEAGADKKALLALHQRVFPRNALAVIDGYVKVAVPEGEAAPTGAIDTDAARLKWAEQEAKDGK